MANIKLSDDGTLDTVLRCDCGEEFRYNFDGDDGDGEVVTDEGWDKAYDTFVAWAIDDATQEHECKSTNKTPVTADNYFDAAQALYWYCSAWHGGQDSELYSIMSARLHYTPGASERGVDPDGEAPEFYAELAGGGWDATELLTAIDAAQDDQG